MLAIWNFAHVLTAVVFISWWGLEVRMRIFAKWWRHTLGLYILLDQSPTTYLAQGYNYQDVTKTNTTSLWLTWQPISRKQTPGTRFLKITTTRTQTLSDSTPTQTLSLTRQPTTWLLLQQRLYLTSTYFWDNSTDLTAYIRVAHKSITTLWHILTNVKDKGQPWNGQEVLYRIKCTACQATCIGETGRNLNTRLTQHKQATKNGDIRNHIAEYHRH